MVVVVVVVVFIRLNNLKQNLAFIMIRKEACKCGIIAMYMVIGRYLLV